MPGWYPCCCGQDGPDFTSECGTICMSVTGTKVNSLSNCSGYLDLDIDRENFEVITSKPDIYTFGCDGSQGAGLFGNQSYNYDFKTHPDDWPVPVPEESKYPWERCRERMETPVDYPGNEACVACFDLPGSFPNMVHEVGATCATDNIACFDQDDPTYGSLHIPCSGKIFIASDAHVWIMIYNIIRGLNGQSNFNSVVWWPAVFKSVEKVTDPFTCEQNLTFDFLCQSQPWNIKSCSEGAIPLAVDFSETEITMKLSNCFKCSFCTSCEVQTELSAVVSGVVNGTCGSCNLLNGTWSCPNFSSYTNSLGEVCSWGSQCFTWTGNTGPCGNANESASLVVQGLTEYDLGVPTRKLKATMRFYNNIGYCNPFTTPTSYVIWERTFDEDGVDCTSFENELLLFVSSSSDLACDFSGSSLLVSVAP